MGSQDREEVCDKLGAAEAQDNQVPHLNSCRATGDLRRRGLLGEGQDSSSALCGEHVSVV